MFNKFSKVFFNVISAVTHFSMLCLILAIPVFLIWQGEKDPEFAVFSCTVEPAAGDSVLASDGISGDGWYRITYDCGATSGKYSPFTYSVGYFDLRAPKNLVKTKNYVLAENGPFEFTGGDYTDFTLVLYIQTANETDAQTVADTVGFGSRQVTKGFSMIKKEITFIMPGFDTADCRADAPIGG